MINPVIVILEGAFKRVVRCLWKEGLVPVKVKTPSVFAKILTVFIKISTVFDKIPTVLYVFLRGDNDVAYSCPYFSGISSRVFFRRVQKGSTVAMRARSVVVWGDFIVGPKLTTSRWGYLPRITEHSRPAWST